jgi:hypothetical protein
MGHHQVGYEGELVFVVEGDGKELYRSPALKWNMDPVAIKIPIEGMEELILVVEDGGDGIQSDHANWGDARLLR